MSAPIFIDSEDLVDLARLRKHVQKSDVLMVLLTPGLLSRPWCLIEIVTAVEHHVNIVPVEVQRPGSRYQYPDEEFYSKFLAGKSLSPEAMALLQSEGFTLKVLEQSIRK